MAKKKITIKKIKSPKIAKFKATKPVKTKVNIKSTAGKQTKTIKVGGKVFHTSSSTTGLVSKSRQSRLVSAPKSTIKTPISNKNYNY